MIEVVTGDGTIFSLTDNAESVIPQDRQRTYAISHSRAVEGANWETFGDGLEQPSQIVVKMTLKPGGGRAKQRDTIERVETAISQAVVYRNIYELREYAVAGGHITGESPTDDAYVLTLTFWPSLRRAEFLEGFPLGRLRVITSADGRAEVVPLTGVELTEGAFTLTGANGAVFNFNVLEVHYG